MKFFKVLILCVAMAFSADAAIPDAKEAANAYGHDTVPVTITNTRSGDVDQRLFGQFLERASWGEPGPEGALVPGTNRLQPRVVRLIKNMQVPVIRYPGGTDIDYIDWTDMIDNVPNRVTERPTTIGHTGKPITNRYGIDEYFALRDSLGCETILVVNFLDALSGKKPLADAAIHAAGLIAYSNAPAGAKLPAGMPDWPSVRARNGHSKPYKAEYAQIGNEWWLFRYGPEAKKSPQTMDRQKWVAWYIECIAAYVSAIRAVDPKIKLIIDGQIGGDTEEGILSSNVVRKNINYIALHTYFPGPAHETRRNGIAVSHKEISKLELWRSWISGPGDFGPNGENLAIGPATALAARLGIPVACTEWNWNGWGFKNIDPDLGIDWRLAAGIGSAGFLNGLLRNCNVIKIGCQSNLIGVGWNIGSVWADTAGKQEPYYRSQGIMTAFYNAHHGNRLLQIETGRLPNFRSDLQSGWQKPTAEVSDLDLVATAGKDRVYLHAVNRSLDRPYSIAVDLEEVEPLSASAERYTWDSVENQKPLAAVAEEIWGIEKKTIKISGRHAIVELPPHSVNIVEFPIRTR